MQDELLMLKKTVDAVHPMPEEDWQLFSKQWRKTSINRKQIITAAGDKESCLYFTLEGVQRIFYLDDKGREATLLFTYPPSFGGIIDSLLLQQPSRYFYETITPSQVLQLSWNHLSPLMDQSKAVDAFVRKALTIALSGLLERLAELEVCTSQEKFKKLLHRSPHILHLVPQKYLASYLGMDATNFSKLMNTVRI
jgi:CRP-like cAMP-binding protein